MVRRGLAWRAVCVVVAPGGDVVRVAGLRRLRLDRGGQQRGHGGQYGQMSESQVLSPVVGCAVVGGCAAVCGGRMGEGGGSRHAVSASRSARGAEHGTPQPVLAGRESAHEYGQGGASCEDVRAGQAVDDLALASAVEVAQSGESRGGRHPCVSRPGLAVRARVPVDGEAALGGVQGASGADAVGAHVPGRGGRQPGGDLHVGPRVPGAEDRVGGDVVTRPAPRAPGSAPRRRRSAPASSRTRPVRARACRSAG